MLSFFPKFRILPFTIAACSLMILVKLVAVVQGREHMKEVLASSAIAQEESASENTNQKEKASTSETAVKEAASSEPAFSQGDNPQAAEGSKNVPSAEKNVVPKENTEELVEKCKFNQIEVDLLQSLSARREEIEKWADDVKMQESVLKATELQIDQKIVQMQSLKDEVQRLLKKYDAEANIDLKSLVKIYENMKPKDAARIFNEMEMEIMLEVVDMMSERKAAPILANMDPKKARDLTIELAEKRRLRREATEGIPEAQIPSQNN